jgi:hypothetical protein
MIQKSINANTENLSSKDRPFIQSYSSHPFLDVYGLKCNKGLAFDHVFSQLAEKGEELVLYILVTQKVIIPYLENQTSQLEYILTQD